MFSTPQTRKNSPSSVASVLDGDTNTTVPSETAVETRHLAGSPSGDGEPVLEGISDLGPAVQPEVPSTLSVAGSQIDNTDIDDRSESPAMAYYSNKHRSFRRRYEDWVC